MISRVFKMVALMLCFCLATSLLTSNVFAKTDQSSWLYSEAANVADSDVDLYDDFNSYEPDDDLSSYGKWSVSDIDGEKKFIQVTTGSDKKVRMGVNASSYTGVYINSPTRSAHGTLLISFDITAENMKSASGSGFNLYLVSGSNSYRMMSIDRSRSVSYFVDNINSSGESATIKSTNIKSDETRSIAFLCDTQGKSISVFENGVKVGSVENHDLLVDENKAAVFSSFRARFFVSSSSEYSVLLDNIRILNIPIRNNGLLFKQLLINDGGVQSRLDYIVINNTDQTKDICFYAAIFDKRSLKSVICTPFSVEANHLEMQTAYPKTEDVNKMRVFSFTTDDIVPLASPVEASEIQYLYANKNYNPSKLLLDNQMEGVHPRMMATAADFAEMRENSNLEEMRESVIASADAMIKKGNNDITYSSSNGIFLSAARLIKERAITLAMAYNIAESQIDKEKYFNAAYDVLQKASDFKDWNPSFPLCTSEICSGVAIGYDWISTGLSDTQKQIIETALWDKALSYAYECYQKDSGIWWMTEKANRNVVNNGGFVQGALALLDHPTYKAACNKIIKTGTYCIGYMLEAFNPDGVWDEGNMYLGYILEYLVKTYASLETALGVDFGLKDYAGISKINGYMFYASGCGGRNNFHDDQGSGIVLSNYMLYLAKFFDRPSEIAAYENLRKSKKANFGVGNLLWQRNSEDAYIDYSLDGYFRGTEFVSMRDNWDCDNAKTFLSFHGGKTSGGEGHMHIDAGTFVLDLNGVRWAEDLGSDSVTYDYAVNRKTVYRVRAEGHNTLVINPGDDGTEETLGGGQSENTNAKVTDFCTTADGSRASLDLSSAYSDSCNRAIRTFALTNNRTAAEIKDEIDLKNNSEIYWFMHMKNPDHVTYHDDGSLCIERGDQKIRVSCSYTPASGSTPIQMTIENAEKLGTSPQLEVYGTNPTASEADNSEYKKLVIKITNAPKGNNILQIKIEPTD